jgi:hypothetical protein
MPPSTVITAPLTNEAAGSAAVDRTAARRQEWHKAEYRLDRQAIPRGLPGLGLKTTVRARRPVRLAARRDHLEI